MATPAQRLDTLMDKRRLELGLRWRGVAERAGLTQQTLLQLRKGHAVADHTIAAVEAALEWRAGSIAAVLQGGDPAPTQDALHELSDDGPPWEGTLSGEDPCEPDERLDWRADGGQWYYRISRIQDGQRVAGIGRRMPLEPTPEAIRERVLPLLRPLLQMTENLRVE